MRYGSANFWSTLGRGVRDVGQQHGDLQRLEEDRARAATMQDLDVDLSLAQMGGGRGPAPSTQSTVDMSMAPPDQWDAPELFPTPDAAPAGADGFMETPQFETRGPTTLTRSTVEPGFRDLAGGQFHIEDPEARGIRMEEQGFERSLGREDQVRERTIGRLSPNIQRLGQGISPTDPDYGDVFARSVAEGLNPGDFMPQPEFQPDQQEAWRVGQGFTPTGQQIYPRGGTGSSGSTAPMMTFNQARETIEDALAEPDGIGGFRMPERFTPNDILRFAQELRETGQIPQEAFITGEPDSPALPEPSEERGPGLMERVRGFFGISNPDELRGPSVDMNNPRPEVRAPNNMGLTGPDGSYEVPTGARDSIPEPGGEDEMDFDPFAPVERPEPGVMRYQPGDPRYRQALEMVSSFSNDPEEQRRELEESGWSDLEVQYILQMRRN